MTLPSWKDNPGQGVKTRVALVDEFPVSTGRSEFLTFLILMGLS